MLTQAQIDFLNELIRQVAESPCKEGEDVFRAYGIDYVFPHKRP